MEGSDSEEKEQKDKEGHFNAGQILDETDQVSKLSGDMHGDSRGTWCGGDMEKCEM